jgi:hypothetical protein
MFSSNVQPKRKVRSMRPKTWECHRCGNEYPGYYAKCPIDGTRRDQDSNHRG